MNKSNYKDFIKRKKAQLGKIGFVIISVLFILLVITISAENNETQGNQTDSNYTLVNETIVIINDTLGNETIIENNETNEDDNFVNDSETNQTLTNETIEEVVNETIEEEIIINDTLEDVLNDTLIINETNQTNLTLLDKLNITLEIQEQINPSTQTGLVALYHFNNQSEFGENDTKVYDFSGNGNNGTVVNATWNSAGGILGTGAFEFRNDTNNYIILPKIIAGRSEFTISMWANYTGHPTPQISLMGSVSGGFAILKTTGDNRLYLIFSNSTGQADPVGVSSEGITNGLMLYTFSVNSSGWFSYYRNGTLIYNKTLVGWNNFYAPADNYIGQYALANFFNGTIDEVAIYNRSLSASEVAALYTTTTTGQYLTSCGDLTTANQYYYLMNNVTSAGTCFNVMANNISLDGQGYTINYSHSDFGYAVNVTGYNYTTIKNINVRGNGFSYVASYANVLNLYRSNYNNIINNTILYPSGDRSKSIYLSYSDFNNITGNYILTFSGSLSNAIFFEYGSDNNVVSYNNITGYEETIYISGSNNNTVQYNSLNLTNGGGITTQSVIAIDGQSNNTIIYGNNIMSEQSSGRGIVLSSSGISNVSNNIINTLSNIGIYLSGNTTSHFNHSIESTNLAEGKPVMYNFSINNEVIQNINSSEYGQIICAWCTNVTYNNITMLDGDGISLINNTGSRVQNSNLTSNNGYGVYVYNNGRDNVIENNTINTNTNSNLYGVYVSGSNYNNVSGNTMSTSADRGNGILFLGSNNYNNLVNNLINTSGSQAYAIFFSGGGTSSNNYIANNILSTSGSMGGYGTVTLYSTFVYNTFYNNSLYSLSNVILFRFEDGVNSNTFTSNRLNGGYGYFLYGSNTNNSIINDSLNVGYVGYYLYYGNNSFSSQDTVINNSATGIFVGSTGVNGGEWNFTNVTRADGSPINVSWGTGANGTLNMMWYVDVYANMSNNGTNISGVNVSSYDINGVLKGNSVTDSSGRTRHTLLEYTRNGTSGTNYTYYSNYTINEIYLSTTQTQSLNMSTNRNVEISFNELNLSSCGNLNQSGMVYVLNNNVTSNDTCFTISANNVTLDGNGYTINYSANGSFGYGVNVTGYNFTTIKNVIINEVNESQTNKANIYLSYSNNNTFYNNTLIGAGGVGAYLIRFYLNAVGNNISNNNFINGSIAISITSTNSGSNIIFNNTFNFRANNAILDIYSSDNTISYNNISCNGGGSTMMQIQSNAKYNRIDNNRIYSACGSVLVISGNSSIISNNLIIENSTSYPDLFAIKISSATNNTLINNTLSSIATVSLKITGSYLYHFNNTIDSTNLAEGKPILYNFSLNNYEFSNQDWRNTYGQIICAWCTNVTYNNITMIDGDGISLVNNTGSKIQNSNLTSNNGYGVYVYNDGRYNVIENNTINTNTNFYLYGVYVSSSNYTNITGNNIRNNYTLGYGVYFYNSNYNKIFNNLIYTSAIGISFSTSANYNNASNNNINTAGSSSNGFSLVTSNYNTFSNNNITTSGVSAHGIYTSSSDSNIFSTMTIRSNGSSSNSIYFTNANNFSISDSTFNSSSSPYVDFNIANSVNGGILNLTNVTKANGSPINVSWSTGANGTLNYGWWLDLNTTDPSGNPLGNSVVNATASNGVIGFSGITTNGSGTTRQVLLEYTRNATSGTNYTYYSNYTIRGKDSSSVNHNTVGVSINMSTNKNVNLQIFNSVSSCGTLSTANSYYLLQNNVTSNGTCFTISANNITLDGNGYTINYSANGTVGYGVNVTGYNFTTIKNARVIEGTNTTNSKHGIYFSGVMNGTIINNTLTTLGSSSNGISFSNLASSKYNNISGNVISISGISGASAISLDNNNHDNIITENNITSTSTSGNGINIQLSERNLIRGNNINVTQAYGILLSNSCTNSSIINNSISQGSGANGATYPGIYIGTSSGAILSGNFINSSKNVGIAFSGATSTHFNHSIDSTNLAEGKPVMYNFSLNNAIISNINSSEYGQIICAWCTNVTYNNITMLNGDGISLVNSSNSRVQNSNLTSNNGYGVYVYNNGQNNVIENNTINTNTNSYLYGVYVSVNNYNNVSNNNITTNGSYGYGIYFDGVNNSLIENNKLNISGSSTYSINLGPFPGVGGVYRTTISNNIIYSNNYYKIYLRYKVNDNIFINNSVFGSSYNSIVIYHANNNSFFNETYYAGINFDSGGYVNNSFTGMYLGGAPPVSIYDTGGFFMSNSIINRSSGSIDFNIRTASNGGFWNFTNITKADGSPINVSWGTGANGTLNMMWWMDSYVTDGVSGINVSVSDNNSILRANNLTDSNGRTRFAILEYVQNETSGTNKTYYSNYDIVVRNTTSGDTLFTNTNMSTNRAFTFNLNQINYCGTLATANKIYNLSTNVNSSGTCFNITANNITLNGQGYRVNFSSSSPGYAVFMNSYNYSNIKNIVFDYGPNASAFVYLSYANNAKLINSSLTTTLGAVLTSSNSNNFEINNLSFIVNSGSLSGSISATNSNNLSVLNSYFNGARIDITNGDNVSLQNNNITSGNHAHALSLTGNYANLINNSFYSYGAAGDGYGITLTGRGNNISGNLILTATNNRDALILNNNLGGLVSGNNILSGASYSIYSSSGVGNASTLSAYNSSNLSILRNNISSYGSADNNYGILLTGSSNNSIIANNSISTNATISHGVWLNLTSLVNITGNNITISGTNSNGVYIYSSSNYNIVNNNAITALGSGSTGINVYLGSSNNTLSDNIISSSNGIFSTSTSPNNIVLNNTILYSSTGIFIASTSGWRVTNNTINSSSYGIHLQSNSYNHIITRNTINSSGNGIQLQLGSDNNSFSNMNVRTTGSGNALYITNNNNLNFTISDSILNSTSGIELSISSAASGGEFNFTNVTKANGSPINVSWASGANGTLNMMWYVDTYTNYTNTSIAPSAGIEIYDVNGALKGSGTTDSSGRTRFTLLEYVQNGTSGVGKTFYSNYTINGTLSGFYPRWNSFNLSSNRFEVLSFDATSPTAVLYSPSNGHYSNSATVNLSANISDNHGIRNVSLFVYNNSGTLVNLTVISDFAGNVINAVVGVVYNFLYDGIYTWFYEIFDTTGNRYQTENRTIIIDTTYPLVDFVYPTPQNNSGISVTMNLNASITELNLANITFNFNGTRTNIISPKTLSEGLVLMFNFDNESTYGENESLVYDFSGSGNNGSVINATFNASGKYGGGFDFNGNQQRINIYNNITTNGTSGTYALWINSRGTGDSSQHILSQAKSTYNYCYTLSYNPVARQITYLGANNAPWYSGVYTYNLTDRWTYIIVSWNETKASLYINGSLVSEGATAHCAQTLTGLFSIGSFYTPASNLSFNGSLDEVRIWNRSLSSNEISELYNSSIRKYVLDENNTYYSSEKIYGGYGDKMKLYSSDSLNEIWNLELNRSGLVVGQSYKYNVSVTDLAGNINTSETRTILGNSNPNATRISYTPNDSYSLDPGITVSVNVEVYDSDNNLDYVTLQWANSSSSFTNVSMFNVTSYNYTTNFSANITLNHEDNFRFRIVPFDTEGASTTSTNNTINVFWDCTWNLSSSSLGATAGYDELKGIGNVTLYNTGDIQYSNSNCSLDFRANYNLAEGRIYYNDESYKNLPITGVNTLYAKNSSVIYFNASFLTEITQEDLIITLDEFRSRSDNRYRNISATLVTNQNGPYLFQEITTSPNSVYIKEGNFSLSGYIRNLMGSAVENENNTAYNVTQYFVTPDGFSNVSGESYINYSNISDSQSHYINTNFSFSDIESITPGTKTFYLYSIGYNLTGGEIIDANNLTLLTNSVNITFSCYGESDGILVSACGSLDSDNPIENSTTIITTTTSSGGGGGGGGGGESGTKVNTKADYSIVRGKDNEIYIIFENNKKTDMTSLKFNITGNIAKYIEVIPETLDLLKVGEKLNLTLKILSPTYISLGLAEITLHIRGFVGNTSYSEDRDILLRVNALDEKDADEMIRKSEELINQLKELGYNSEKLNELLAESNISKENLEYEKISANYEVILKEVENAIKADTIIKELEELIKETDEKGIDTDKSKRILKLAKLSMERADFNEAYQRTKEAQVSFALEIKGELGKLSYYIKNNPSEISLGTLFIIFLTFGTYKLQKYRRLKNKIKKYKEEENILIGLIKTIQRDTFVKKKMGMSEYQEAMIQYEKRMANVVEKIIDSETLIAHLFNWNSFEKKLKNEKSRITEVIKELQNSYIKKGSMESRAYELKMESYAKRMAEIEQEIANLEAKEAMKRMKI